MNLLYEAIAAQVDDWRATGYACPDYPAISKILGYALDDERSDQLRFLQKALLRALET